MKKNREKLYTGIFITIIFSVFITFFIYSKDRKIVAENIIQESTIPSLEINNEVKNKTTTKTINSVSAVEKTAEQETKKVEENTQSVTILTGGTTTHLPITPNTLFYDALVEAKEDGKIIFDGKNYPGLGFFVTEIGTLRADSGKYLLYYINGEKATVGVSSYTLKDGDVIEWKLE